MATTVRYEWDVETVFVYDDNDEDILDHAHVDSAAEAIRFTQPPQRGEYDGATGTYITRVVLVCDLLNEDGDLTDRGWAYVEDDHTLPSDFEDAGFATIRKVPKRFHVEYAKAITATHGE